MTMEIPPETRSRNRWLFVALVAFAILLCAVCLWWMRGVVRANGGVVDPQRTSFVLPTAEPCLT